jgi:hypothetical protein
MLSGMFSTYNTSKTAIMLHVKLLHAGTDAINAGRNFLTRAYPTMKHHNPYTPIMIREAMGIEPRVFARYEFGREKRVDLNGAYTHRNHANETC